MEMDYRKWQANDIFSGTGWLGSNQVLITTNQGVVVDIIEEKDAGDGITKLAGFLSPGFINAHCHLELSHMKGMIPMHTGLTEFILQIVQLRKSEDDIIYQSIAAAEKQMWENGIVAVGDICNNEYSLLQKKKGSLQYHNFIEISGVPAFIAQNRIQAGIDLVNKFKAELQLPNTASAASTIVPHAPYSVSAELFNLINDQTAHQLLSIHNQETMEENELFQYGTGAFMDMFQQMNIDASSFQPSGTSSLQKWVPYFNKEQSLLLVHNVVTNTNDMDFLNKQQSLGKTCYLCLCPNANLYITNSLPDLQALLPYSNAMVIGTDSLASNHQLSVWEEIKVLKKHYPTVDTSLLLQWGTINGARALKMEDQLGSFEIGKQPGLVLIEGTENKEDLSNSSSSRIF